MTKQEQDAIDYYIDMCYKSVNECLQSTKPFIELPGVETCVWLCTIFLEKCKTFRIHYKNNSGSKLKSLDVCINACQVCLNHCAKHGNAELKESIKACWLWIKECEAVLRGKSVDLQQSVLSASLA
ncbi:MAG: hypothetical protein V4565_01815 [Bacteroidota bacterium]